MFCCSGFSIRLSLCKRIFVSILNMKSLISKILLFIGIAALVGCKDKAPNQELEEWVELERFMGTWYVHGYTPTFMDKDPFGATETYKLNNSGKIETTYRYNVGDSNGKEKVLRPIGWVFDETNNAEWRMRFFGVLTSPYYILHVDDVYQHTVVGHPGKKMSWIMSRSPEIDEQVYESLLNELREREYDLEAIERMVH